MPLPSPARDDRNAPAGKTGNRDAEPGRASGSGAGTPRKVDPAKDKPATRPHSSRKPH